MFKCLENIICIIIIYIKAVIGICVVEEIAKAAKKKIKDRRQDIAKQDRENKQTG